MSIKPSLGLALTLAFGATAISPVASRAQTTFNSAFEAIRSRPEFTHSTFGVEVYSLDRQQVLYQWNGDKLFVPGSTTKLLTEGTALQLLGPDFRFHTKVYRTGEIEDGVLQGDLVLVASGDPNLSGRLRPDGTLTFSDTDHSYGGFDAKVVEGDPTAPLQSLARQIAAAGVRRVAGRVRVDASLFEEGPREGGTGKVISPIIVNDNVIDVVVGPGGSAGQPARIRIAPSPSYMRFVSEITTGAAGSQPVFDQSERRRSDGSVEVTLRGSIPIDRGEFVYAYGVGEPSRFAAALFAAALEKAGVSVTEKGPPATPADDRFEASYTPQNRIAEFVSAPLTEDVKVTLKTSQNLHAGEMPFVLGAVLGHAKGSSAQSGFQLEHDFLAKAGLDLSAAHQSDGAGAAALFTPEFMTRYLAYMARQPAFEAFRNALPVLGKDGSLHNIATASPAAGHVFAKTGTLAQPNLLNGDVTVTGKALAGYTTTPSGEHVAFAVFVNNVPLRGDGNEATLSEKVEVVGQAVGSIAAAVNTLPITPAS